MFQNKKCFFNYVATRYGIFRAHPNLCQISLSLLLALEILKIIREVHDQLYFVQP